MPQVPALAVHHGGISLVVRALLWLCLALIPLSVSAKCQLPVPDGGGEGYVPSKPNLHGEIEGVRLPIVRIRDRETGTIGAVSLKGLRDAFSVYGGDAPLSQLKPRVQVWVWFKNCARPKRGMPIAAYLQIFSSDPTDRATVDRTGRIVAVPK